MIISWLEETVRKMVYMYYYFLLSYRITANPFMLNCSTLKKTDANGVAYVYLFLSKCTVTFAQSKSQYVLCYISLKL